MIAPEVEVNRKLNLLVRMFFIILSKLGLRFKWASLKSRIIFFDGTDISIRELERRYNFLFPVYNRGARVKGKMVLMNNGEATVIDTDDFNCLSDYSVRILKRNRLENEFELTEDQLRLIEHRNN